MVTEELLGLVIPTVFFLTVVVIVWLVLAFRHRSRQEVQATYRAAIERGQELTPELLDRLGEARPKNRDLRRGVVLAGIGLGLAAFGLLLGEEDATRPLMAIGAFPFLVGIAYLGLWRFNRNEE